jgi:hypothetical protein
MHVPPITRNGCYVWVRKGGISGRWMDHVLIFSLFLIDPLCLCSTIGGPFLPVSHWGVPRPTPQLSA